jgi:hypothetical protein
MPEPKRYLGDGVYVAFDGYAIVLTAENGICVTDRVVLEPRVYNALVEYVEHPSYGLSEPGTKPGETTTGASPKLHLKRAKPNRV